jgi:hypothetical protein
MVPRSLFSAVSVLVLVVLEALTPISTAAWAVEGPFPPDQVLTASGGVEPQAVVTSPAGCSGKSNNPHKDTEGTIKGLTPTAAQVKASGIYGACENNAWRTEGEHWSTEVDGTFYGHTIRYADVKNC